MPPESPTFSSTLPAPVLLDYVIDFVFVLVLRDPARNHHVAHVWACRSVLLDVNAVPESHVVRDVRGRRRRLPVVPRGVLVDLSVHHQRVVLRRTLPRA